QNLTPEQWYGGLLGLLGAQLGIEEELEEFWVGHPQVGPLQRWMRALREVVLPNLGIQVFGSSGIQEGTQPDRDPEHLKTRIPEYPSLVIFVDEIDAVRSLPFSTDEFFAGIRECYN